MAAHLNPFFEDDEKAKNNSFEKDYENDEKLCETKGEKPMDCSEINADAVAAKLLKDNFVLTALEFHTELLEAGRELPRLRNYFSNPLNFEKSRLTAELSATNLRTYMFLYRALRPEQNNLDIFRPLWLV